MSVPADYLERVYAAVLGKLIGVYLGRPFEMWSHERILRELGEIHWYQNEKTGEPLVVTDDDVSGTFMFLRALEEHGAGPNISAEQIGKTWLNNIILGRSVFWWGGNGVSTEHTAFLNLKKGVPAPDSGSMNRNGKIIAGQIGAQIFIDGWALVSPGNPAQAVRLAEQAASVSHDGISVQCAMMLAAMEAEAFSSADVDHLLDTGLHYVPSQPLIHQVVSDVRGWAKQDHDWYKTLARIDDIYSTAKYPGACHVIPNFARIILALVYGGKSFHDAMSIVCTAGFDTDCNGGNIGCLLAIMHGLTGFENGPDWRQPLADRALLSGSDGGYAVNNAARIAYDVVNMGRQLNGLEALPAPKRGAYFHFTLPGSCQGFRASTSSHKTSAARIEQGVDKEGRTGLGIHLHDLSKTESVEIVTDTFTPVDAMNTKTYELMASPLVYSGQNVRAQLHSAISDTDSIFASIRIKVNNEEGSLSTFDGPFTSIASNSSQTLAWRLPETDGQPIQQIGLFIKSTSQKPISGVIWLDHLSWSGPPRLTLKTPTKDASKPIPGQTIATGTSTKCDYWRRAWVRGVSLWNTELSAPFCISQDQGEGIIIHGTRDWTDYQVVCTGFTVHLGTPAGLAARVQGLNRYYALMLLDHGRLAIVKKYDEKREELAVTDFAWELETAYNVKLIVNGSRISGSVEGGPLLEAEDSTYKCGGIGLIVTEGAVSAQQFDIDAVEL